MPKKKTKFELGTHHIGGEDYEVKYDTTKGLILRRLRNRKTTIIPLADVLELHLGQPMLFN